MLVTVDEDTFGNRCGHPAFGRTRPCIGYGIDREHAEVDGRLFERAALVEAGQQEQVVDERSHAHRLGLGAPHRLLQLLALFEPAAPVQLGVAADGRDRRAQLVRRVGDELPQSLLRCRPLVERLLDAGQHRC